jgi:acetyl esterase/lipase
MEPSYDASEVNITSDMVYGNAFNSKTGKNETLMLDMYMPPAIDNRTKRPATVYIHGGGYFESGDKADNNTKTLMIEFARRGYVAFSINYRLTGGAGDWKNESMIYDAVDDARAAIRFVRKNEKVFRVDNVRINAMGDSAGAIASLFLGYVKQA